MRHPNLNRFADADALEAQCGADLLGRLGRELQNVYRDAAEAPLPPRLRDLVARLDAALARGVAPDAEAKPRDG